MHIATRFELQKKAKYTTKFEFIVRITKSLGSTQYERTHVESCTNLQTRGVV